jgi:NhaA family Na+:H+ antiporter
LPPPLFRRLVAPLEAFFQTEALGGTVLIAATAAALAWANSPAGASYRALFATEVTIGVRGFALTKTLVLWINDLLMAVFFLLVGLEIKRELLTGELRTPRKAAGPALAALGGMIAPALIFAALARGTPAARGWGVPMATDIAFALGCLRLLGGRVPGGLVAFLTALAIMDDLGAIAVIAIFYASDLRAGPFVLAAILGLGLFAMNRLGVRRAVWYALAGIPLWLAVLESGVHATIAGVVVGICVPARGRAAADPAHAPPGEPDSPLASLERALHPFVAFLVVPLFALANAGLPLAGMSAADLRAPAALATCAGLFLGKQVGIFGATRIAVAAGLAELPEGTSWRHIYGLAVLAGIGFTMSLFVASLAYGEGSRLDEQAKLGVLAGSLGSALAGLALLGRRQARSA